MIKNNLLAELSKNFALRIIKLHKFLREERQEYVISKQIYRSGTSIGANIAESECANSRKDFLFKLYIALKESAETMYWLDLLYETEFIDDKMYRSMHDDCEEIKKILQASTKTISSE